MNYPSPCDTCPKCTVTNGCDRWMIRYRYRQKQINAYARNLVEKKNKPEEKTFLPIHIRMKFGDT